MDGGSHFINEEYLGFTILRLKQIYSWLTEIRYMPFAKYHSKSDVDRLFGIITCWYWAYITMQFLGSAPDLRDAFIRGAELSKKKYEDMGVDKYRILG